MVVIVSVVSICMVYVLFMFVLVSWVVVIGVGMFYYRLVLFLMKFVCIYCVLVRNVGIVC